MKKSILSTFFILMTLWAFAQGIPVPQMSHCDSKVQSFMTTHNIPSATIAIAKDGKLVYNRAFGHSDIAGMTSTQPHNLFRIASISKPVTSIAIMKMMENGDLAMSDKVFGTNGILGNHTILSQANITDSRVYNITVQHLLEHSAGWNRNVACTPTPASPYTFGFQHCDPIGFPLHVAQTYNVANPVAEEYLIQYVLEKSLAFAPGTSYAYSNMGYLVLGEIIEEISGKSYEDYVKDEILSPLGICDMHIGKNLLADKQEREGEYVGNGYQISSCYGTNVLVPWEYGGFNVEAMDAHGGWIATSRDLVRLLVAVDGFSTKPDILSTSTLNTMSMPSSNNSNYAKGWSVNSSNNWWHSGALDGTASIFVRSSNGYTWAIILNKRVIDGTSNQFWADFDNLPWSCVTQTASFPTHDFFAAPTENTTSLAKGFMNENAVELNWTRGDGNGCIVVATQGTDIENFPLDGTNYAADAAFGSGYDLGDGTYVVYKGTADNVTVTGLNQGSTYTFRVFEYTVNSQTGNLFLYKLCGGESIKVTPQVVSTNMIEQKRVKLYPTITTDFVQVELDENYQNVQYQIVNTSGQLLRQATINNNMQRISVNDLPKGIYFIKIRFDDDITIWRKFVKQ
ncbi:MAG: serine hydrolase [Saprospiraceae bacterium]